MGAEYRQRVYPRRCGGTLFSKILGGIGAGLSPQVRGNRRHRAGWYRQRGSIPAGAGEPSPPGSTLPRCRVYPRRCGGTTRRDYDELTKWGLSPQVRGNPGMHIRPSVIVRSIPAGAGEPLQHPGGPRVNGVYPRRCGGTDEAIIDGTDYPGLSPQVRGNPPPGVGATSRTGSIPAGAGEPARAIVVSLTPWVYPRRCGGTVL